MSLCQSVCLVVINLSAFPSICLSVSLRLYVCVTICLSARLFVCLPLSLPVCPSTRPFVCLYLSVCLSVSLSVCHKGRCQRLCIVPVRVAVQKYMRQGLLMPASAT